MTGSRTVKPHERVGESVYRAVPANSEITSEVIIPAGEIWHIRHFQGSAAYLSDTVVCLIWDRGEAGEIILGATHGDADAPIDLELTGDGIKAIVIVIDNGSPKSQTMGAAWEGIKL